MDPPHQLPPQPLQSSPSALASLSPSSSPSTPLSTTTTRPPPSLSSQTAVAAAQALINHNRRADGEGLSGSAAAAPSSSKKMTIRDAAAKWNCSKTTVARHLKALLETNRPFASDRPPGRPRALAVDEEEALAAFCVYLAQGNCMGNIPLVHKAANELRARRNPPMGPCHRRWVCRWLVERTDLTLRNIPRADRQYRVEGPEEVVVKGFFDRYFADKVERDRRAVQELLANGGAGRRVGQGGQRVTEPAAREVPLDPRLAMTEEAGGSQQSLGQGPV